jgi:putative ABC transport system permease protein
MLTNYFKIALRIIRKDNIFTLINVAGLATGLAVALLIIQYVRFELSYENNIPEADRVVRITMDYLNGEAVDAQDAETYPPMAAKARREMSEVADYTRAKPLNKKLTIRFNEAFHVVDKALAVDSSFFRMFNYPLVRGSYKNIFTAPRQAVLTETMALTYFKTLDIVGKTLEIHRPEKSIILEITGVVPDSPANTHLKFDMLISHPTMFSDFGLQEDDWGGNNTYTYLKLAENTDYDAFTKSLTAFSDRLISEKKISNERVIGQKISDIHLYSHKTYEAEPNGEARSVYFLLGVAFLVLVSAFVNYVNLTTSKALDRAKEMGLRKVIGSTISQLRTQIFMETVVVNSIAVVVALGLVAALRPAFVTVAGLPEGFTVFSNVFFWQSLGAFFVFSSVMSGIYPAFVLSSFNPVTVLKGNFSRSLKGAFLRKSLVVFQLAVTLILLVQTFAVYRQVSFLREQNLGVNIDHTLVVNAPVGNNTEQNYDSFQQTLHGQSQVKSISFSGTVPGLESSQMSTTTGINLSDAVKKTYHNYYITRIDTSFIDLMGLRLLAGKNFDAATRPGFSDTTNRQLIVNEETIRLWGIPTPGEAIDKRVDLWGNKATIRAVVNNYHHESPKSAFIPIIMMYSPHFETFTSVKFTEGNAADHLSILKKAYETSFPHSPFSYFFLDSEYDKQYKADDSFQQVFGALTAFAILISCLGLFGLATFSVSKRTKEIGIRKVIGATTMSLLLLLSKDFIKTVLLSILIGLPLTYFIVSSWLANYAARIELSWWIFAAPAALIMLLVIISVGSKTIASALMNPVKSLKSE